MMTRIRLGVSVLGMVLAVAAMTRNDIRLTWVAIGVLVLAFVLRFMHPRNPGPTPPPS